MQQMTSMPDIASADDERFMQAALQLAAQGQGCVEPNPMVGCVLVRDDRIIGQGYHARFGGPHAELAALQSLPHANDAHGATAYVTLEPCCHHGKTPPCADALINAGVKRVVAAMQDPHKQVDGGGLKRLHDAGIATTVGVMRTEAEQLVAPYLKRMHHQLPYVIAKWAITADGNIATTVGQSKWISGPQSRKQVHMLRGRVDAIVAGMGTVQADDPLLTARPPGPRIAKRVVFCRSSLPSLQSRLIGSIDSAPVILAVAPTIPDSDLDLLRNRGAQVVRCDSDDGARMAIDALRYLASDSATNVMLEGGGELMWSFLSANQIDEFHVYIAAKIFAGKDSPSPVAGDGVLTIDQAAQLQLQSIDRFDNDVRLIYLNRS